MRPRAPLLAIGAGILLPMLGAALALADPAAGVRFEARSSTEMARKLLARAIAIRYACDSRARIDLRMRDGRGGERHRRIQTIAKHIDGRMHSIGRLISPRHLRGVTILSIEARDRGDDVFVYLPSLGRVRRVSMAVMVNRVILGLRFAVGCRIGGFPAVVKPICASRPDSLVSAAKAPS